jgi:hypothetical protein
MKNHQPTIADILDQALDLLKQGASFDDVLFAFPEYKEELSPLLETLQLGLSIPTKEVPRPALQRKYLHTQPAFSLWTKYLSLTKFALMPLGLFLVLVSVFTAQANPGQPFLYSLKQGVQKAPLALITNPDLKAAKKVELSEKTLNEAEAFLNSEHSNATINAGVVADLAKQTSETVASVKDLAASNAISRKNNELLNKLVIISQKQEKLVNAIKSSETQDDQVSTLEASKTEASKTLAEVNQLLATVNEQVLANLHEENKDENIEEKPKSEKPALPKPAASATEPKTQDPESNVVNEIQAPEVLGSFILEYPSETPQTK